jgi:hypothetical protein
MTIDQLVDFTTLGYSLFTLKTRNAFRNCSSINNQHDIVLDILQISVKKTFRELFVFIYPTA